MPDFFHFLQTFQEHLKAEFSRTDVLRALIWPIGGLLIALSAAFYAHAPEWLLIAFFVLLCLFLMLYGGAYIFFAATDPDALRSERYKLQKMAIEQGLYGDSQHGFVEASELNTSSDITDVAPMLEQK